MPMSALFEAQVMHANQAVAVQCKVAQCSVLTQFAIVFPMHLPWHLALRGMCCLPFLIPTPSLPPQCACHYYFHDHHYYLTVPVMRLEILLNEHTAHNTY